MQYTSREKLAIVEIKKGQNSISFESLAEIISLYPMNTIYCEQDGRIHGIISMGDIRRASGVGKQSVRFKTEFLYVLHGEFMKAKEIFFQRKNINALPVLDESGTLLGEYTRWDDLLYRNKYPRGGKKKHIAMVRPSKLFVQKQQIYNSVCKFLLEEGHDVERIYPEEIIDYIDTVDVVLFADKEECSAYETLIVFIKHSSSSELKFKTYSEYFNGIQSIFEKYLYQLQKKGVITIKLFFGENKYCRELKKDIIERQMFEAVIQSDYGVPQKFYKDFFDELYSEEYGNDINNIRLKISINTDSECSKLEDCHSKYYNVENGERHTIGQPETYNKTIYMVGPCTTLGAFAEDKNTIPSFLQKKLNDGKYQIKVVNASSLDYQRMDKALSRIMDIPFKAGDILVYYCTEAREVYVKGGKELNLSEVLERYKVEAKWLLDNEQHCNHKVNSLYAKAVFEALEPILSEKVEKRGEYIEKEVDVIKHIYIDQYFKNDDFNEYNKVGAIVMNCNPFTYGHRYLIEKALGYVDYLILFIVEENESIFSFEERFAMVQDGVADLENVIVVPSGPFILSKTTFPEYFVKTKDEDLIKNVENDITLFAEKIAPHLNISYRFVGEEPGDVVTREYNEAMKRIFPKYGINLIEIPRKENNGQYISASLVRRCLEKNDMKKIEKMLPETTKRLLVIKNE